MYSIDLFQPLPSYSVIVVVADLSRASLSGEIGGGGGGGQKRDQKETVELSNVV